MREYKPGECEAGSRTKCKCDSCGGRERRGPGDGFSDEGNEARIPRPTNKKLKRQGLAQKKPPSAGLGVQGGGPKVEKRKA
jgi:hypothetical protein